MRSVYFVLRRSRWSKQLLPLWLIVGLLAPILPQAAPSVELYQASVPVSGQGVDARQLAIKQALERVLVKLTGSRSVAARPETKGLLDAAAGLVQQYRYETLAVADAAQPEQRLLNVSFDSVALRRALRDNGLSVWRADRPSVLLWLGLEQRGTRRFFQAELDAGLTAAIEAVSAERGMPLLFPLLDVEDLKQIQAGDLWGGFESRLLDASQRYDADLVLVGRAAALNAKRWRSTWMLLRSDQVTQWQSTAQTQSAAIVAGLQEAVDRLAAHYAPMPSGKTSNRLLVQVHDVRDLHGFVKLVQFFRSLDGVDELALVSVEPDGLLLGVKARGGIDALRQASALNRMLIEAPRDSTASASANIPDLSFRLVR